MLDNSFIPTADDASIVSVGSSEEDECMAAMRHGYTGQPGHLQRRTYAFSPYNSAEYERKRPRFSVYGDIGGNTFARDEFGGEFGIESKRMSPFASPVAPTATGLGISSARDASDSTSGSEAPKLKRHRSLHDMIGKTYEESGKKELLGIRLSFRKLFHREHEDV